MTYEEGLCMRYNMSQDLSSKIDKLVVDGVRDLNIYIPDGKIFALTEYVKKKVKWIVLFNLRQTIIEYIDIHGYVYTDFGDSLYRLLNYIGDDSNTKSRESTSLFIIQVDLVVPVDMSTLDVCYVYHHITQSQRCKDINPDEITQIEHELDMNLFNRLYELFTNEFEFILRKGIFDLEIEVNEDVNDDYLVY